MERRFLKAVETMRGAGLTVHEIGYSEGESRVLGWSIDGSGHLGPTLSRLLEDPHWDQGAIEKGGGLVASN